MKARTAFILKRSLNENKVKTVVCIVHPIHKQSNNFGALYKSLPILSKLIPNILK